jgi:hypothetical protein
MPHHFLTDHEHAVVTRLADLLLAPEGGFPGGGGAGAADYVDQLLGAFSFDPPRIWAGGPYSGRSGGDAGFDRFLPLSRVEDLAWRTRIEGSQGMVEREWNGPVRGWQEVYRDGIVALGDDFLERVEDEQRAALDEQVELRALVFDHACEASYGPPEYGGNIGLAGWQVIAYAGDTQPRGWSDDEVRDA